MALFARKRGRVREKWTYESKSELLSGPMVYDVDGNGNKEIVFGTKDGRVFLMDQSSNIKWEYNIKEEIGDVESFFQDAETANSITSTPLISDINNDKLNEVIFGTENGTIYCLNNKGHIEWKFHADDAVRTSVLLHDVNNDGLLEVLFGCSSGKLYILGAWGKLLWKYEGDSPIDSAPNVIPELGAIIFGCRDGSVRCLDYNKKELWRFNTKEKVVAKPIIAELGNKKAIIVGSTDYNMYALDLNGKLLWNYETEGSILCEATIEDIDGDGKKEIIFGSCDNQVYVLKDNGDKMWSYETYFWVVAPPIATDIDGDGKKEVVVGSYDHNIYILDSKGSYSLDYVPGLGGIIQQAGHYGSFMTKEPGQLKAKEIWRYTTKGFVVGCASDDKTQNIIVNIKEGFVQDLIYQE